MNVNRIFAFFLFFLFAVTTLLSAQNRHESTDGIVSNFDIDSLQKETSKTFIDFAEGSTLHITGRSNLNEFSCLSKHDISNKNLLINYDRRAQNINITNAILELEVTQFDCGRSPINRDFRNTLKADQYPFILLQLNEVLYGESNGESNSETMLDPRQADISIKIAGVTIREIVDIVVTDPQEEIVAVQGQKRLRITDFNLTPPTAMFGLIKVEDELDIVFDLRLKRR